MNADDFGYFRSVNYGIVDGFQNGIVRSTTMAANMPGFEHAAELAKKNPQLGVGIHLVLTAGRALTGANWTITDEQGNFLNQLVLAKKAPEQIDLAEVEKEYTAQIEKVIAAGIKPTHLDSHHHSHELPGIFSVFLKIARKYNLPIRLSSRERLPEEYQDIKSADYFSSDFYGNELTKQSLKDILEPYIHTDKIVEIMCHPAYVDQQLMRESRYHLPRTKELEIILDMGDYIKENHIELINFRMLN